MTTLLCPGLYAVCQRCRNEPMQTVFIDRNIHRQFLVSRFQKLLVCYHDSIRRMKRTINIESFLYLRRMCLLYTNFRLQFCKINLSPCPMDLPYQQQALTCSSRLGQEKFYASKKLESARQLKIQGYLLPSLATYVLSLGTT